MCSPAGKLENGALCSHLLTPETSQLTFEQFVAFLEANQDHGAALCMSTKDWGSMKTELEQACRELGPRCSLATQRVISVLP